MSVRVVVLVIVAFSIVGCARTSSSAPDCKAPDVDFEALFQDGYVRPFREGRAEEWAKIFAPHAVALHNRRPADVGVEAIAKFGGLVAETFTLVEYDVRIVETQADCNWAMSRGEYKSALAFRETGEPAPWGPETGKFLIVWRRQADGSWKIVADMGNSNQ